MKKWIFIAIVAITLWIAFIPSVLAAEFEWTAPTTYEDGSPLTDAEISNYTIYCGSTPLMDTIVKDVGKPDKNAEGFVPYTVSNVINTSGRYFCAVTATSDMGAESLKSNIAFFDYDAGTGTATFIRPDRPGAFKIKN